MPIQPIPPGYHTVTPYLIVQGAAAAIEFYKQALGATERMRFAQPNGKIGHAELEIGDSVIMLADEVPEMGILAPQSTGGKTPVSLALYVEDVDEVAEKAVDGGAEILFPVEDHFYGDRAGRLKDPFGHVWMVSTHKEDVSAEEMERRAAEIFG